MRKLSLALALTALAVPAYSARPAIFQATSSEKASGFRSMVECETALGGLTRQRGKSDIERNAVHGSLFNRQAGNLSRCEMIDGEPQIVVYPVGYDHRVAN